MGLVDLAKQIVAPKPTLDVEEFRGSKPVKSPFVEETPGKDGALLLCAPLELQGRGMMGWIAKRMKAPSTKTFELEEVGAFVWSLCDGTHSFEAIAKKLRDRYKMNRLEAEAALTAFLKMLGQRRLITLRVSAPTKGKRK